MGKASAQKSGNRFPGELMRNQDIEAGTVAVIRPATVADQPRIIAIRMGVRENQLSDPSR